MRIYRVIINNFRSIKYLDFKPDMINLLVGRSNSGKTNILTALDYCLNPYRNWYAGIISEHDFHKRDLHCEGTTYDGEKVEGINIEVWLTDFRDGEDVGNDWDLCYEYINQNDEIIDNEDTASDTPHIIRITFECGNDLKPNFYFTKPDVNRKRFTTIDKEKIGFHLVPAYRDPLKELSFYQNSFLSRLLESEDLKEQIDSVITDLNKAGQHLFRDSRFKAEFEKLQLTLSNLSLTGQDPDSLDLEVYGLSNRRILQNFGLVFKSDKSAKHIPLRYQGYGAQNAMLITAILQLISTKLEKNLIVAFEEPEQNLEPYFQRLLIKRISRLSDEGLSSQILMTTHSRDVVEMFSLANVYIVNAEEGYRKHQIVLVHQDRAYPDWKKFLNTMARKNKSEVVNGFFAKAILLVEGLSEKGGLPIFSRNLERGFDEFGIEVIWCDGKGEIPKYARYFKDLSMKVISLCDHDLAQSSNKEFRQICKTSDLTIRWNGDYEIALLSSSGFREKFFDICQTEFDWSLQKQVYLKKTFSVADKKGRPKSKTLYDAYHFYPEIEKFQTLDQLLEFLERKGLLFEYQKVFLHEHCSNVRVARLFANMICTDIREIPIEIQKLFHLISEYHKPGFSKFNSGDVIELNSSRVAEVVSGKPFAIQLC